MFYGKMSNYDVKVSGIAFCLKNSGIQKNSHGITGKIKEAVPVKIIC